MTKAEWLSCTDPEPMLEFLWGEPYERKLRKSRERKTRLFAIACLLPVLHRISHEPGLEAVEVSERFADGLATEAELETAREQLSRRNWETGWVMAAEAASAIGGACWSPWTCSNGNQASYTASWTVEAGRYEFDGTETEREEYAKTEALRQCVLLRDIFGPLPFRKVSIPAFVLARNDGCVVNLAMGIYRDRDFDRLPILADALEDAGCTDADILDHCRQTGPHVKGCWALDALLDKQ